MHDAALPPELGGLRLQHGNALDLTSLTPGTNGAGLNLLVCSLNSETLPFPSWKQGQHKFVIEIFFPLLSEQLPSALEELAKSLRGRLETLELSGVQSSSLSDEENQC